MPSAQGRLRIAHVIFRLDVGGLENGLVNLINGLPADRFEHSIICIDRSTDFRRRIQHEDVRIEEIRRRPGRDPGASWRIYKTLREIRPDVLHTRNLPALDALLPGFAAGVRVRVHGEHGRNADDPSGDNRKHRLLRRIHAPLVSRFVALSKETKDYLTDKVGIREKRISQIYNGVDVERFRPVEDRAGLRRELNLPFDAEDFVFGFVGRLDPVKNPQLLLDAFETVVRESGSRVKLAVIGDGPLREELESAVTARRLEEQCWVAGARGDVPDVMRCCDVFVLPSLVEGVSNTILEAMASGLPVIATDVGGNAELVEESRCGYLTPSGDVAAMSEAMTVYLDNSDFRATHGRYSRERAVSKFSMETMIEGYRQLYESVYESKTSRRRTRSN